MALRTPLLVFVAALLALAAWRDAAVAYWISLDPVRAPALLGSDARLALAVTDAEAPVHGDKDFWRSVPEVARRAARVAPLDPMPVRQLGFAEDALGRPGLDRYLGLAERISRRDVPTQVGLLRLAAEANRYPPSFSHLDLILTITPDVGAQFYAPMAALLAEPAVRNIMASYTRRPWFGDFAGAAAQESEDPEDLASLLIESHAVLPARPASLLPRLLGRLVDAGNYQKARDLALHVGRASVPALDDFAMTGATTDLRFAPLTWRLAQTEAVQAGLANDGALVIELSANSSAQIADRVTSLAPGNYTIEHAILRDGDGGELLLTWELFCGQGDEAKLAWQQRLPLQLPVPKGREYFRSHLEVPKDCPIQQWRLVGMADETQSDTTFRIAQLRISRS